MKIIKRLVAVNNKCAWPNLTLMPDGAIVATIFGEPTHGRWEGDVECWQSKDDGKTWSLVGIPAPHEPSTNRMNVAAGLAHNNDLLVISSGWSDRPAPPPEGEPLSPHEGHTLFPWVCRSKDGGKTWERNENIEIPEELENITPFGDIVKIGENKLAFGAYHSYAEFHNDNVNKSSSFDQNTNTPTITYLF